MKRILIALPLMAGLALPLFATASLPAQVGKAVLESVDTELPWSTVSAVLKRVSELYDYTYAALVDGYHAGLVTVEQSGSGYLVRITDEDGIVQQILIDDL